MRTGRPVKVPNGRNLTVRISGDDFPALLAALEKRRYDTLTDLLRAYIREGVERDSKRPARALPENDVARQLFDISRRCTRVARLLASREDLTISKKGNF